VLMQLIDACICLSNESTGCRLPEQLSRPDVRMIVFPRSGCVVFISSSCCVTPRLLIKFGESCPSGSSHLESRDGRFG